ncbi:hypothetical protein AX16_003459 [Volvariella volvacea WC 439]|nr:hypothetical protein AX16_003459 [Volvariella volvacea WC 439]
MSDHQHSPATPIMDKVKLACLILGMDPPFDRIIIIKVSLDTTIAELKEVIWERSDRTFPAVRFDLYAPEAPISHKTPATFNRIISELNIHDESAFKKLSSWTMISDLAQLKNPQPQQLHIIAYHQFEPQYRLSTVEEARTDEDRDLVPDWSFHYQNFMKVVTNVGSAPSKASKSSSYALNQATDARVIFDGRYDPNHPLNTIAPPIELFHPIFSQFTALNSQSIVVPDDIVRGTASLLRYASAIRPEILGIQVLQLVNDDKSIPDGVHLLTVGSESYPLLVLEVKRELGEGGSDPAVQVSFSYKRSWLQMRMVDARNKCCCPSFLIGAAGPNIAVLGAVFTDKIIVQRLTDYLWTGRAKTFEQDHVYRVARSLFALQQCLGGLADWYRNLSSVSPLVPNEPHPRYFPYPNTYIEEDEYGNKNVKKFEYLVALETESTCVTYLAAEVVDGATTEGRHKLVIKFSDRYGEDAHRHVHSIGYAPRLRYCGRFPVGNHNEPSPEGLFMVVMDYIPGRTVHQKYGPDTPFVDAAVRDGIKAALDTLHERNIAFGDLRRPNVVIGEDGRPYLIDFDWSGEAGQAKYPLYISESIRWPPGVQALSPITKDHDIWMLDHHFAIAPQSK